MNNNNINDDEKILKLGWTVYETIGDTYDCITNLPHEELLQQGFKVTPRTNYSLDEIYFCYFRQYDNNNNKTETKLYYGNTINDNPGHVVGLKSKSFDNHKHPEVIKFIHDFYETTKKHNNGVLPPKTQKRIEYDKDQEMIKNAFESTQDFIISHYFGSGNYLRIITNTIKETPRLITFINSLPQYNVDAWKYNKKRGGAGLGTIITTTHDDDDEEENDYLCFRFNKKLLEWQKYNDD